MRKKLLYIGNNLKTGNPTTTKHLSEILISIGFEVNIYSNKKNKVVRLFDMILGVFKNKDSSYILIDTYSTTNFYYALLISQLARILRIPYIPILHGGNLPYRLKKFPYFSKLIFSNSFINVSPSIYLKEEFQKRNFKTLFIPNGIRIENYTFEQKEFKSPKILWVRAFDAIYNPKMAVKSLLLVKKI